MLGSSGMTGAALVPLKIDFRHSVAADMWMGFSIMQPRSVDDVKENKKIDYAGRKNTNFCVPIKVEIKRVLTSNKNISTYRSAVTLILRIWAHLILHCHFFKALSI